MRQPKRATNRAVDLNEGLTAREIRGADKIDALIRARVFTLDELYAWRRRDFHKFLIRQKAKEAEQRRDRRRAA